MALPTSTIVMALVTCVPFGLAIRDTVKGGDAKGRHGGDYEDYAELERESRHELERIERQERFERAEREARAKQWKKLYGVNVASFGGAFDGLWWDMPERQIHRAIGGSLGRFERAAGVEIELTNEPHLLAIEVRANTPDYDEDQERCAGLLNDLEAAWGEGAVDPEWDTVTWFNAELRTRATFRQRDACVLRFEQAVSIEAWLDKSPASVVPVWAVGEPVERLQQALGERATLEDDVLSWKGPGLGTGTTVTHLTAVIEKGKVRVLSVIAGGIAETTASVRAHLTSMYGAPRETDDAFEWKKKPPIRLGGEDDGVELTIGTLPED